MILTTLCLAVASAVPQAPACLSGFQRVAAFAPVASDYRFLGVRIDGDTAIATGRHGFPPHATRLDVFERDPATGRWAATQSIPLDSHFSILNGFELEGGRLAVRRGLMPGVEITVLEPDAITGQWRRVTGISGPYVKTVRMSGDRIAMGAESPTRIEVWARTPAGNYALEDTILPPGPGSLDFPDDFALEGDRLISNAYGKLDVYRRSPTGVWALESRLDPPVGMGLTLFGARPRFVGGRVFHDIVFWGSSNFADGVAMWRMTGGTVATRIAFDGIVENGQIGNGIRWGGRAAFAQGTAVVTLYPGPCSGTPVDIRQLGFIAAGRSDRPTVLGHICQLAGSTTVHEVIGFDYDGRTVAVAFRGNPPPDGPSIHFATLMGADLDGDADCTDDALQIAANPALDRNGNGRLDVIEERGEINCVPPPNSAGTVAELRVIGTEFVPTTDLAALATGLPPFTFGVLAVAMSPLPGQPMGPFQLCIGAGGMGGFGRYMALQADGLGTALLPLPSTLIPSAGGIIVGLPGDTWGWQLVHRDGPGVGSSSAVRVTLR